MIRRPPRSPLFPSTPLFRSTSLLMPLYAWRFRGVDVIVGCNQPSAWIAWWAARLIDVPYVVYLNQPNRLRSEEHTSELQSPCNLVCRLLLEKKKRIQTSMLVMCLKYSASSSVDTRLYLASNIRYTTLANHIMTHTRVASCNIHSADDSPVID